MKTWRIWNRGYKAKDFIAPTIEEAMDQARAADHIRKGYRKYKEITE